MSCMSRDSRRSRIQKHSQVGQQNPNRRNRGICMSAALSYPVSALKSSARSRSQILILEPDLAVLDYLRLALGSQYSLHLFSEEQALLDRLEKAEPPDLRPLALHTRPEPAPLL